MKDPGRNAGFYLPQIGGVGKEKKEKKKRARCCFHLKIISKKQAFETRKIIQSPEKTGPSLVSCGIFYLFFFFFNFRGLSSACCRFCQGDSGHLQDAFTSSNKHKPDFFGRRIGSSRSTLEKDPLSCSQEQTGRFIQLPSTLNFLFHPLFFLPSTPQVFCFSEELGFCSLKSLLPVLNHWRRESKTSRGGKLLLFPQKEMGRA